MAEDGVRLDHFLRGPACHQLPQLKGRLARTHLSLRPAHCPDVPRRLTRLSCGRLTPTVSPNLDSNRPQFQRDPGVDVHRALYPLRLRVVESNNVAHSSVTGCVVLSRHVPTWEPAACLAHGRFPKICSAQVAFHARGCDS
jgi:hypothetical protein